MEGHEYFLFDVPAQAFGHSEEVAAQDMGEEGAARFGALEELVAGVVVGAEGQPVADALWEEAGADLERPLFEVYGFYLEFDFAGAEAQGAHALLEEGVDLVGPFVEADQGRLAVQAFVLDQGVGVAQAFVVEVVVEEAVFPFHGLDDGSPELRQFGGADVGLELYPQVLDACHRISSLTFVEVYTIATRAAVYLTDRRPEAEASAQRGVAITGQMLFFRNALLK